MTQNSSTGIPEFLLSNSTHLAENLTPEEFEPGSPKISQKPRASPHQLSFPNAEDVGRRLSAELDPTEPSPSVTSPLTGGVDHASTSKLVETTSKELEQEFDRQLRMGLQLLKAKVFGLLNLFADADEAETNLQEVELLREAAAHSSASSRSNQNARVKIDSQFRFCYEEIALRWHSHRELGCDVQSFRRAVAEEIDRRINSEENQMRLGAQLRELQNKITVADEVALRRKRQHSTNLEQYHQELRILHLRVAELQKKLDIRETMPKLLDGGGAGEEDDVLKQAEREERQHVEFMYRKANEEVQIYKRTLEERSSLIQVLEEELEAERSEAKALRREFRLYLEEQEQIDADFRRKLLQEEQLLASEKEKSAQLTHLLTSESQRATENVEKMAKMKSEMVRLEKDLEEAQSKLKTAGEAVTSGSFAAPSTQDSRKSSIVSSPQQRRDSLATTSQKNLKGKPPGGKKGRRESEFSVPQEELHALEVAHADVQHLAEERATQLNSAQQQNQTLQKALEEQRLQLQESSNALASTEKKFLAFQDASQAKEQTTLQERTRERAFLKKQIFDLETKLTKQENDVDAKLKEMKQIEEDLLRDIALMHKQFAVVEDFLTLHYGEGSITALSDALVEANAVGSSAHIASPTGGEEGGSLHRRDSSLKDMLPFRGGGNIGGDDERQSLGSPKKRGSRSSSFPGRLGEETSGAQDDDTVETQQANFQMVIEDLLSQQRLQLALQRKLENQYNEMKESYEVLQRQRASPGPGPFMAPKIASVKKSDRRSRKGYGEDLSASLDSSSTTGVQRIDASLATVGSTTLELERNVNELAGVPIDLSVVQLFPGVECATEYFDLFETFCSLRRQLAQLVLVCSRELDHKTLHPSRPKPRKAELLKLDSGNAEMTKILLNEKFVVFRAIESLSSTLVNKLHRKKDDMMRRREEELERVLSTMQNISMTHPKEVNQLAKIARKSASQRDTVVVESAELQNPKPRAVTPVVPFREETVTVRPSTRPSTALGHPTQSREAPVGRQPVQHASMTLEVERVSFARPKTAAVPIPSRGRK